jgi:hypothetical protein
MIFYRALPIKPQTLFIKITCNIAKKLHHN